MPMQMGAVGLPKASRVVAVTQCCVPTGLVSDFGASARVAGVPGTHVFVAVSPGSLRVRSRAEPQGPRFFAWRKELGQQCRGHGTQYCSGLVSGPVRNLRLTSYDLRLAAEPAVGRLRGSVERRDGRPRRLRLGRAVPLRRKAWRHA